jgi:hypothetical protein
MTDTIARPKDDITWHVMQDLLSRANRGVQKYTTTLQENNHDEFLNHLYEELLDAAQYVKKEISIRQTVHQLAKDYTNDKELGEAVRRIYG